MNHLLSQCYFGLIEKLLYFFKYFCFILYFSVFNVNFFCVCFLLFLLVYILLILISVLVLVILAQVKLNENETFCLKYNKVF